MLGLNKLKSSYMVQNYKKLIPYIRPYKWRAILAMTLTIPIGMMDAATAWVLKPYMDEVMIQKVEGAALFFPIFIIVISLAQSLLNYGSLYLNTWVGRKVSNNLKLTLFDKLMTSDAAFYDKANSGDILFRYSNDVDSACNGFLGQMKLLFTRIFSSISLICVLFWNSWQLATLAVVVLFFALYPLTLMRKRIKGLVEESVFAGSDVLTHYNEAYNGNRIIASYNLHHYMKNKFANILHSMFNLGMKMVKRTGMLTPLMHFIVSLGIAGVIWLQSYLIISGQITPGNFISFLTALIMLYTPIKNMGNSFTGIHMSLMAIERVFTIIDTPPAIANKENAVVLTEVKDKIEYKDVKFAYSSGKPVLKGVNLTIDAGKTYAFVGNSGGGKTTMANLLPRFYEVKSGAITIDGTDVKDIDMDSLRENISIVFQDNFLFRGSIRENIILDKKDITDEEVFSVLKSACLDDFVNTLENGLDTEIGERGVLLSGGQKQRIGIARAFIKNSPIVILDEATSALDNKSEAVVQQAINNLMKDRTVIIIAHRLSTIRNADSIVVINEGEIVEQGNHDELIEKDSFYASLYKTQLS